MECISQYDMVIQHRPASKHVNANAVSHCQDTLEYCNCYEAGTTLEFLPCGGCPSCSCLHNQWAWFEDDVVPLAVHQSIADPEETDWEDILSSEFPITEEATTWLPQYSPVQLWDFQMDDPDVAPLIEWLESGEPPSIENLYLSSPAIKHWWLSQSQLELHQGVLYY